MTMNRRSAMLAALSALPAGCAIQPLGAVATTPVEPPAGVGPLRAPAVGQRWTYRKLNRFNGSLVEVVQESVAAVAPTVDIQRQSENGGELPAEKHAAWGQLLRDPAWDYPMNFEAPVPLWPTPLAAGTRAAADTRYRTDGGSVRFWIQVQSRVRGWERLTVAAGTFDALRVERFIRVEHQDHLRAETTRSDVMWIAPQVGRWVARETSGVYRLQGQRLIDESPEDRFRWELTAWR
jgi:hypothetical protein